MNSTPTYSTPAFQALLHLINSAERVRSYDSALRNDNQTQYFIPIGRIERYFEGGGDYFERAERLLRATFDPDDSGTRHIPVSARDVAQRCCRVFCILVRLGKPELIQTFVLYESLWDNRLPFDAGAPPEGFPHDLDTELYQKFVAQQWMFCAPKLYYTSKIHLNPNKILPFLSCDRKAGGVSATVYQVRIHEAHDDLTSDNPSHCYAVKTFKRRDAQSNYERESRAFSHITHGNTRSREGLIGFYGGFEYRDTFNLILEWAEGGTLEDFFKHEHCPSTGNAIYDLWTGVLETVKGLVVIHEQQLILEQGPSNSGNTVLLQGWHQDLKPANILLITNNSGKGYKWKFKVADFGLSHFKTVMEKGGPEQVDMDTFGTRTYGAPETQPFSRFEEFRDRNIARSTDVWSLGCILIEVSAWCVNGWQGLLEFRHMRKEASDNLNTNVKDCFHDGEKMHDRISQWLRDLAKEFHKHDFVTGKVRDNMIREMLHKNRTLRPNANQLQGKVEMLLEEAGNDLRAIFAGRMNDPFIVHAPSPPPNLPTPSQPPSGRRDTNSGTARPPPTWYGFGPACQTPHSGSFHDSGPLTEAGPSSSPSSIPLDAVTGLPIIANGVNDTPTRPRRATTKTTHHPSLSSGAVSDPVGLSPPAQLQHELSFLSRPRQGSLTDREAPFSMSYRDAKDWYDLMKVDGSDKSFKLPHHEETFQLTGRDHVIVIDDSESMKDFKSTSTEEKDREWPTLIELARVIAYIVKHFDPNGVDLRFMRSSEKLDNRSDTSRIIHTIIGHSFKGKTSLTHCFDDLLQRYGHRIDDWKNGKRGFRNLGQPAKRPNPVTYYIFTDGVWQGGKDFGQPAIVRLAEKLHSADMPRSQVGIQFISFGDNPAGQQRLRELDCLNKTQGLKLDIVDTEPFNGNVWKMLLGAINQRFDDVDEGEDLPQASPISMRISQ